jgi:hypothetical protein
MKQGMEPRQWAQLHPAEWERLVEIAPLKRRDSQPTRVTVVFFAFTQPISLSAG